MACFFLHVTDDPRQEPTPELAAGSDRLQRRGLSGAIDLFRTGFQLRYYPKILSSEPQLAQAPDGSFALATGTCIYGNAYGARAMAALLADFEPDWTCLDRATGQFGLIVFKEGALHVGTDRGGFHHIYHDTAETVFSNSFLAVCSAVPRCSPLEINIHERIVCGAIHGPETVFKEIVRIPPRQAYQILPDRRLVAKAPLPDIANDLGNRKDALERCASALVENLKPIASIWPHHLMSPLTGGYDSRLLAAVLRAAGAHPEYLIYGSPSDRDVQISKQICHHHGWSLTHLDKSEWPTPTVDRFQEMADQNFHFHDGRGTFGVLDNGSDRKSRFERAADGRLYLNGSGGGIFRDAFDLGRQRCSASYFVRARYERLDRGFFHDDFCWDSLIRHAAWRIPPLFDPPTAELKNWRIHALLSRWRLRYWMSPDNQDNNLLAPALVPYTDPALTELALGLPQRWRDDGIFEAALIRELDPELAAHMSSYGWRFSASPPQRVRMRRRLKQAMPGFLRRRWQRRVVNQALATANLPAWLDKDHEAALLGNGPRLMDEFVHVDRVRTAIQRNVVLSLELLLREFT